MTPQKVFMGYTTGKTCYFLAFHPDGRVLDAQAKAWVSYNVSDLANYFIDYAEFASSGFYSGVYPSGFVLDVLPTEVSYQQAGPAPAFPADTLIGVGQSQGANMASVNASVLAAENLQVSANTMIPGVVQSGANSATQIVSDLDGAIDNLYNGRVIIFSSGGVQYAAAIITGYVATTHVLTFTAIVGAPSPADTFLVV